jgi:hypothetical protein
VSEAGETVIDLTVGAALLMLLAAVLVTVLTVTDTGAAAVASKSGVESEARRILSGLARDIRSARPIGWCPTAPPGQQYSTPLTSCAHVADYTGFPPDASAPGGPVIYADGGQLWFWDYAMVDGAGGASDPLGVPDCVHAHTTPEHTILVDRWAGTGTFTNATCAGVTFSKDGNAPSTTGTPASSRFVGALAPGAPTDIFGATDRDGGPAATPSSIVLVTIRTTLTFRAGMASAASAPLPVEVEAAVRGAVYRQEQAWAG